MTAQKFLCVSNHSVLLTLAASALEKITKIKQNLWERQDVDTILGTVAEGNIILRVRDLKRLLLENWLSDDIINSYFV